MSAARSLPDGDVLTEKILEQLRKKSPMSPGDLTAAVRGEKVTVRARVKKLAAAGVVTLTGVTMSRQIHLANGKTPAAAAKPNGSMRSGAPSSSPLGVVEERDRAILQIIKDARGTGRTVRELAISRPEDSQGAIEAAILRLKVKKLIEADDNGRWTAV